MKTTTWTLDRYHSEIGFKVKHLMIATVSGKFENYDLQLESEAADFSDAVIRFSAEVGSINTGIEARDNHLRSDDFFNAEKYPQLSFVSTSFKHVSDDEYALTGDLTIRDVTKSVTLKVTLGGVMIDPYGNTKVGFEIDGKIQRKEFNLTWNAVTESGGVVVSDDVRLHMALQVQKHVEEAVLA